MGNLITFLPLYREEQVGQYNRVKRLNPVQIESAILQLAKHHHIERLHAVHGVSRGIREGTTITRDFARQAVHGEVPLAALALCLTPLREKPYRIYHALELFEQHTRLEREPEPLTTEELEDALERLSRAYDITVECQASGVGAKIASTVLQEDPRYRGRYIEVPKPMYCDRDREGNPLSILILSLVPLPTLKRYT